MIVWIHNSELKSTVVLGDTTYAPSDDPNDCQPMPEELRVSLGLNAPTATVVEVQATPEPAPAPTKKG
jgi:hypothetical protein